MIRFLILALLFLLFGCSKVQQKNRAKLQISSAALFSGQPAGVMLYIINKDLNTQRSLAIDSNQVTVELEDGNWEFAVVAWDGISGVMTGTPSCGKATVTLASSDTEVHLPLGTSNCNDNYFTPSTYRVSGSTDPLRLVNCSDLSSAAANANCNGTSRGVAAYYRVRLLAYPDQSLTGLSGLNFNQSSSLTSSCIAAASSPSSITSSALKIPYGGTGLKPSLVIETFSDAACQTSFKNFFYPNGLSGVESTPNNSALFSSSPSAGVGMGDMFLELGIYSLTGNLNLGSSVINSPLTQTLILTNNSQYAFSSLTRTISGSGFTVSGGSCGTSLAAGVSCTLIVQFQSSTAGAYTGSLALSFTNNSTSYTFNRSLMATATTVASLSLSSTYSFGNVIKGTSKTSTFTLTNSGGTQASSVNLTLSSDLPFTKSTNCGATLAPTQTCSVIVTYSPSTATSASNTLSLSYNNGNAATSSTMSLSGTGVELFSGTLALPPATVGISTGNQTVTMTNSTATNFTSFSIGSLSSPFTLVSTTCGSTLNSGVSCVAVVSFSSATAGNYSQNMTVSYNDGASQSVSRAITATALTVANLSFAISGTGVSSVSFGNVLLNTYKNQTVTITNSGQSEATFSTTPASASAFTYPANTCGSTLAAGVSCTYTVRLTPSSEVTYTGSLSLSFNNGATTATAALSLSGAGKELHVTDGDVKTMVKYGNNILIGGTFTRIGPRTGQAVKLLKPSATSCAGLTCLSSTPSPKVEGVVNATVYDGSGGYYIGGDFTKVGGLARNNLAYVDSSGNVSTTFAPQAPNGVVNTLLLNGSTLFIGGNFSSIGASTRFSLAAVSSSTGSLDSGFIFDAKVGTAAGHVHALLVNSGTLYVGGAFTAINTTGRNHLAAITIGSYALDTSFNPNVSGGTSTHVKVLALNGSLLYFGGDFTTLGGSFSRSSIAAWDFSGPGLHSFAPTLSTAGTIYAITLNSSGSMVYFSGNFTQVNTVTAYGFVGYDTASTGSAAVTFNPSPNSAVTALASDGSQLYVGGNFTSFTNVSGGARTRFAAFNISGVTPSLMSFDPAFNRPVKTISFNASTLVAGGDFTSLGGEIRKGVAEIDTSTGGPTSFNPAPNGDVHSMVLDGSTLYLAGTFTSLGMTTRNRLAAVTVPSGALVSGFNPSVTGTNIYSMVLDGSTLYFGGLFSSVGGSARTCLAAVNTSTGNVVSGFAPTISSGGVVKSLAIDGSYLYTAGAFTSIGGQTRTGFAELDVSTGSATTFNPAPNGDVARLLTDGSILYVGGTFTSISSSTRNRMAAYDITTSPSLTAFNPNASSDVSALALSGSSLFAVGGFSTIGLTYSRMGFAEIDTATTGTPTALNISTSGMNTLVPDSDKIFFGGGFSNFAGESRSGIFVKGK